MGRKKEASAGHTKCGRGKERKKKEEKYRSGRERERERDEHFSFCCWIDGRVGGRGAVKK